MSTELLIASLPTIIQLIEKGFALTTPGGVKICTLEELKDYTKRLEALPDVSKKPGLLDKIKSVFK